MKIALNHKYEDIISVENILEAWQEFLSGKRNKPDVQEFSLRLMNNIFSLCYDLANYTYKHGGYQQFKILDPKPRDIHKASVRDRLVHRAIYRILYPFFNRTFIADSYSCRIGKGTHKALNRFRLFAFKVSKNNTKIFWILKCDIKKFFASVDHNILTDILQKYISDNDINWLLGEVIGSFSSSKRKGLPLGNLTSQLFANIYLNELDQFVKHILKIKHYIRYCDDFVILNEKKEYLKYLVFQIDNFFKEKLKLSLHSDKIIIRKYHQGIDFLGYVTLPYYRILRTKTKKRILKKVNSKNISSYLGILKHCSGYKIIQQLNKILLS